MRLPGIDQVPEWMATDLANLKIPGSSPGLGKFFFFFFVLCEPQANLW